MLIHFYQPWYHHQQGQMNRSSATAWKLHIFGLFESPNYSSYHLELPEVSKDDTPYHSNRNIKTYLTKQTSCYSTKCLIVFFSNYTIRGAQFSKYLGATSKFQVPFGWHEAASFVLGPTNIRHHYTKFSCWGDHTPTICAPLLCIPFN